MSSRRLSWSRALLGAAVMLLAPGVAHAASCAAIKAELSSLRQAGTAPTGGKWQRAHDQQLTSITAAERDARYFRCDTLGSSPKCQGLNAKLKRMRQNLKAIDRKLAASSAAPSGNSKRIRSLERKLRSAECAEPRQEIQAAANPGGLLAKLFDGNLGQNTDGGDVYRTLPNGLVVRNARTSLADAHVQGQKLAALSSRARLAGNRDGRRGRIPSGGTFRTLCVRTCDGYFFPVSFSTGEDQFLDDAARCGEICPAAPTELFVHRNPGGFQDEMISLQGVPYTETENAYRFKSEYVPNCACRQTRDARSMSKMTPMAQSGEVITDADGRVRVSLRLDAPAPFFVEPPQRGQGNDWRRDPMLPDQLPAGEDPATRLDMEGGFNSLIRPAFEGEQVAELKAGAEAATTRSLPVLGRSAATKHDDPDAVSEYGQEAAPEPVFSKAGEPGFAPRTDSGPIRVVGPEYFVAQ
ncbi:DUF2865 domain-containing protein [Roseibium sp.]|uniref:DUF2865 domain-containing protein n=1 Tax=Roseibium sp. TaxID=1936156 RepID=UPI003A97C3AC